MDKKMLANTALKHSDARDIHDTEADLHVVGHAVLAVQGEGHDSAWDERHEEIRPVPDTEQDALPHQNRTP